MIALAQAATGAGAQCAPREGDGFTFEHLAGRDELWLDFCADTGDGGCAAAACGARACGCGTASCRQARAVRSYILG